MVALQSCSNPVLLRGVVKGNEKNAHQAEIFHSWQTAVELMGTDIHSAHQMVTLHFHLRINSVAWTAVGNKCGQKMN